MGRGGSWRGVWFRLGMGLWALVNVILDVFCQDRRHMIGRFGYGVGNGCFGIIMGWWFGKV